MSRVILFPIIAGALLVAPAVLVAMELEGPPVRAAGPGLSLDDWPMTEAERRGRAVYERRCIGCHGETGKGDGEAASLLDPKPRNFLSGSFKFRTTTDQSLPSISDLVRTIRCGLPGSSMPAFRLMPQQHVRDVAEYVLWFATFGSATIEVEARMEEGGKTLEQVLEDVDSMSREIRAQLLGSRVALAVPAEVPSTPDSIAAGRALYIESCAQCHGTTGEGDGASSPWLRDDWDARIYARDFTAGVFRGGSSPTDLFLRLKGGLKGTPMPAFKRKTDGQLWSIVHYVMSLLKQDTIPLTRRMGCTHDGGSR